MFSWIVGLLAINFSTNSASASASAWESFYVSGYNIVNLVDANAPIGPPNPGCSVDVYLTGSGIALSIALPLAFFMSVSILISTCCFLSVYSGSLYNTGYTVDWVQPSNGYNATGSVAPGASPGLRQYHITYSEECRVSDEDVPPSYQNQSSDAALGSNIYSEAKEGDTGASIAQPYGSTLLSK